MIDLSKYRIIDLSYELIPGERKINGEYLHGEPWVMRPLEVQEFMAYGARMHFIQGQTHCGTHCEGAYKYLDEGPDVAGMRLESYLGEAAVCNFSDKEGGEAISAEDFRREGVRKGDIVLARTSAELMGDLPYMTGEALDWLIEMEMKLLASGGNLRYGPTREGHLAAERRLLENGIAMVDALYGLDQIVKKRVFFIGMPVKMRRVTAAWTRAVALEEIGPDG